MVRYEAIAIGCSAGGFHALDTILSSLPSEFSLPIFVVQHLQPSSPSLMASMLQDKCAIQVKEADDKEPVESGYAYIAPPNYHMFVEEGPQLSLSVDEKENHARPSIDVLFESASRVYREKLVGVVLTGASSDGAKGLSSIKKAGGMAIVQDPKTAESPVMPTSAMHATKVDQVLPLELIPKVFTHLDRQRKVI